MFVVYKLATFQSRHILSRFSTLLSKPPTPCRERIDNFLKNIKQFQTEKTAKLQKIVFLNSQLQNTELELKELKIFTQTNPELCEIGTNDADVISKAIDGLYKDILSVLYELAGEEYPGECIVEIRSAAGGAEASLFARDLYVMYQQVASRRKWNLEEFELNKTELGGVRNVSFSVEGEKCFEELRFEGGVHRVQRVPYTSGAKKLHTSTVTVAVLSVPKDQEVVLDPSELRVEAVRATGAGGQYVNTTDSAVRVTHIPTGIIVACQMFRSQIQNKEKALEMLKVKLFDFMNSPAQNERVQTRRSQVGFGDRSEKIRTYNFPDDRITDHRIGQTIKGIDSFLSGELLGCFVSQMAEVTREIKLSELLDSVTD